jgi:hypothetical protein
MSQNEKLQPKRQLLPVILVAIGLLLVAGVVIWQVFRPGQVKIINARPTGTADPNRPFPEIIRVTLEEAKAAFDGKMAIFVDVRSADSFNTAHVPGAVNIPLAELEGRISELNPDNWIITYCT